MPADPEEEEEEDTLPVTEAPVVQTISASKKRRNKKNKNKAAVVGGEAASPEEGEENVPTNGADEKTATKKRNKKRGHGAKKLPTHVLPAQDNSALRCLGDWKEITTAQTSPPTVQIEKLFPKKSFPLGEIQEYTGSNAYRTTSAEMKEADKVIEEDVINMREAAECHRQVRKYAQTIARP
ncbi:methionine aminopeptidase, putative, partial [Perkinsus marinus ATCC 50983]